MVGVPASFAQKTLDLQPDSLKGQDSFIQEGYHDYNWGSLTYLHTAVWTHGPVSRERSLIRFDLSPVAANSTVSSAILFLYADPSEPGVPPHQQQNPGDSFAVHRIASAWSEGSVTWDTQPDTLSENKVRAILTNDVNKNYEIDVTAMVQDMVSQPDHNFGFMLSMVDETIVYNCLNFFSSDDTIAGARPRLRVEYTEHPQGKVYELITPNGDGKNDVLWVDSLEAFHAREVSIYNQWGNVVFHTAAYANDWSGAGLSGGMYYYVVKLDDQELTGKVFLEK